MNWDKKVRQIHRWLSMAFTVMVIANIIVNVVGVGQEEFGLWLGLLALLPLALLFLSGLYLFVLPYAAKRRSGRRSGTLE